MRYGGRFKSGRLGTGRFASRFAGVGSAVKATVTGLTDNPQHGLSAQIGNTLTGAITGLAGGETIVHRWAAPAGLIAGANAATYTVALGGNVTDGAAIWYSPTVDGVEVNSPSYPVRRAAPVATGSIVDQDMVLTQAEVTVAADVSALFAGDDLTYGVSGYAGASLDGTALKIDPTEAVSGATITLTATNSGGAAEQTLALDVTQLAFATGPILLGTGKIDTTHTVTATANLPGASLSYDFLSDGVSIGAADQATYDAQAADDETDLSCAVDLTKAGVTVSATTNAIGITYTAPVAAGGLADQSYAQDAAITTLDVSTDFTGSGIAYALAPSSAALPAGLSLASNGEITGTPTAEAAQVNIVVRGTNSGGFDDAAFGITITAAAGGGDVTTSFGALTLEGAGGVPVTGTSISSGDASGHWQIANGELSPSAAGVGNLAGTYDLTLNNGQTVAITIAGNTYSAKCDKAEIEAAHNAAPLAATTICSVREGSTTDVIDITGKNFTGSFTLTGQGFATLAAVKPRNWLWGATTGGVLFDGTNVHIENMEVFAPKYGPMRGNGGISNVGAIHDFSIKRCHIHSTPMATHVEQMWTVGAPEISEQVKGIDLTQTGVSGTNGVIADCYIHDTRNVISANVDNLVIEGVESWDSVEGWITTINSGSTGMIIRHCEHTGMWAAGNQDPHTGPGLDQHSGMGGGSVIGGETGVTGKLIGCVVTNAGWRRRAHDVSMSRTPSNMSGTTGFKLNDPNPNTANGYDGWEIKHNLFLCEASYATNQENGRNIDYAYNTLVGDLESGQGTGNIYMDDQDPGYTDTTGIRIWNNLMGGVNYNGLNTEAEKLGVASSTFDNVKLTVSNELNAGVVDGRSFLSYFNGHPQKGFTGLTAEELIVAFTPKAGTYAATANVGAVNSYMTIGVAGKGTVDTTPAFSQPSSAGSATGTGHSYSRTIWDGTVGLELSSDPTHGQKLTTSTGVIAPNGKQLTIVGQLEFDASVDGAVVVLYADATDGLTIQRGGSKPHLEVSWSSPDGGVILHAETLMEPTSSYGMFAFAVAIDLANDRLTFALNGKAVTAESLWTATGDARFNDALGDFQAPNVHILEDTAGANRFTGKLDFFGVVDSFVDLETAAGLETLFAADGTLLDLTSAGYLVALAGNEAAFNSGAGNSNGAAQAVVTTGAGSVADDGAGGGGITVVGTATGLAENNADAVITLPSTPAENDVVVVIRAQDADSGSGMPTISGYTSAVSATADVPNFDISWKRLGGTPDTTVTVPEDATLGADAYDQAVIVYLLRGVNTATAIDVTPPAVATGTGSSVTPPAITTVTAGALVITAVGLDDRGGDGTTVTATPAGYTDLATQNTTGAFNQSAMVTSAAKLVTPDGTETPGAYTFSNGDAYVGATIAFRPA